MHLDIETKQEGMTGSLKLHRLWGFTLDIKTWCPQMSFKATTIHFFSVPTFIQAIQLNNERLLCLYYVVKSRWSLNVAPNTSSDKKLKLNINNQPTPTSSSPNQPKILITSNETGDARLNNQQECAPQFLQ